MKKPTKKPAAKRARAKKVPAQKAVAKQTPPKQTPPKQTPPKATSARRPQASGLVRYAALLRGVSPMNCKMPELKAAFEKHGFSDVKTVISSGNVVFSAPAALESRVEQECEAAMAKHLGRVFKTFVRRVDVLRALLAADPYAAFSLPAGAKRVVTFLPQPLSKRSRLPIEHRGASILLEHEREVLSFYVPGPDGPVFMTLLEKTYGKDITTRTWDTVEKLAR